MKKWFWSLGLLSFVSLTFAQSLDVQIKQDGQIINSQDGVYHLKKKEFAYVVNAKDIEGFLVGATFDESIYKNAIGPFNPTVTWFQNTGMAEELYNLEKDMTITDEAPSYWYYTDARDHRFDKTPKGNLKNWSGTRTVKQVFDVAEGIPQTISEINKPIYVIFYEAKNDENYEVIGKKNLFHATLKFDK